MCVGGFLFWGNFTCDLRKSFRWFQQLKVIKEQTKTKKKKNAFIFLLGEGYNFFSLSHSPNEDMRCFRATHADKKKIIHHVCRLPNHIPNIITNKDLVLVCFFFFSWVAERKEEKTNPKTLNVAITEWVRREEKKKNFWRTIFLPD